jgi:hypothetical protein
MDARSPSLIGHGLERTKARGAPTPSVNDVVEDSAIIVDTTLDECMQILDETVRHLYSHQAPSTLEWCAIATQLDVIATMLKALVTSRAGAVPHLRPA